jgi:hypothetical protein
MLSKRAKIGRETVLANCAPELEAQADWLLDLFARMHESGRLMQEGKRVQVGWSILILRRSTSADELVICEPDFAHNPFVDVVEDVTSTLRVLVGQNELVQRAGAETVGISFQDKIVMAKGCLEHESVCMQRGEVHPEKSDSGWFLGPQERSDSSPELEAIHAYQLLVQRPELVPALALPPGYMVMANREHIQTIFNSNNEIVQQS